MPPSLRRASMRYLPASVVPINESPSFSSATPSAGQSVVASGYSTPHLGHLFIASSAYHTVNDLKRIGYRAPLWSGRRQKKYGREVPPVIKRTNYCVNSFVGGPR